MDNLILTQIGKIIVPFIQVFGVYIILFGHLSPGGGFAGGTIIGVGFILYRLIFGKEVLRKKLKYDNLKGFLSISLIFYGTIKGYSFVTGGSNLHAPSIPLGYPGRILSGGYLVPLNISVGIIVSITIYFLFRLFYEGDI